MSTYNCHFDLRDYFMSQLFNLKELHKTIMEQRTYQSLSFATTITKLPFPCSFVATREPEGTRCQVFKR